MAPEVARKFKVGRITEKADIYSLGCILYYLTTRKEAFNGEEKDEKEISKKIANLIKKVDKNHDKFTLLF